MSYLYFWGKPITKQLQKSPNQNEIQCVETDQAVKQVSCGFEHAFLLSETNQVYAMGSNQYGQCGAGYLKDIPIYKIIVPTKSKVVSISCGWQHTLILDQLGSVFTAGSGAQGATGQGTKQNSYIFKHILTGVRKISAGMDHSLAIKQNKVFGWGNNDYGQLGMHAKRNYLTPTELNIYPCNQLCAGSKYSIFITIKGIYGCGLNNNFQLGLGHDKNIHYPKALNLDEQLQKVYCGNYCIGKSKSKEWFIWGSGVIGVFKYPTKAKFFQGCEKLSLGANFGMMLKNDRIYVWGSNNNGQLGTDLLEQNTKDYVHQSQNLSDLLLHEFSCGVKYCIGVSRQERKPNPTNNNTYSQTRQTQFNYIKSRNPKGNLLRSNKDYLKGSVKTCYDGRNMFYSDENMGQNDKKMRTVYTDCDGRMRRRDYHDGYLHSIYNQNQNQKGCKKSKKDLPISQYKQNDKQNQQNFQKLRKAIEIYKKKQISSQNNQCSDYYQKTNQQERNQQYERQFFQYGENLQRLKQLLKETQIQRKLTQVQVNQSDEKQQQYNEK